MIADIPLETHFQQTSGQVIFASSEGKPKPESASGSGGARFARINAMQSYFKLKPGFNLEQLNRQITGLLAQDQSTESSIFGATGRDACKRRPGKNSPGDKKNYPAAAHSQLPYQRYPGDKQWQSAVPELAVYLWRCRPGAGGTDYFLYQFY